MSLNNVCMSIFSNFFSICISLHKVMRFFKLVFKKIIKMYINTLIQFKFLKCKHVNLFTFFFGLHSLLYKIYFIIKSTMWQDIYQSCIMITPIWNMIFHCCGNTYASYSNNSCSHNNKKVFLFYFFLLHVNFISIFFFPFNDLKIRIRND